VSSRTDSDQLLEDIARRLREYDAQPPGALFEELVEHGFIDRQGRVTTLLGGDAPMEPGARPPVDGE
jgi:hypothetical protein